LAWAFGSEFKFVQCDQEKNTFQHAAPAAREESMREQRALALKDARNLCGKGLR